MRFLVRLLLNGIAIIVAAWLLPGIHITSPFAGLVAGIILGFVNAIVRPVLFVLTLPFTLVTLGLFIFVLNGLLFWLVGSFIQGFVVAGFWSGVFGAIVFSLISWILSGLLLGSGEPRTR